MRTLSLLLALFLLPCSQGVGQSLFQTLPVGFDAVQGGAGTSFPFNSTTDHTWQWHYANSNFTGLTGPITIIEVSVRALSATASVGAFNYSSLEVVLGTATTGYQFLQHDPTFANNLCSDQVTFRTGPFVGGPVPPAPGGTTSPWIPLSGGQPFNPFTFDPTSGRDLIVQLRTCGVVSTFATSLDGVTGSVGAVGGNRYGSTSSCTATTQSFNNNEFVPVVQIEYVLGGTPGLCLLPYQINNSGASLTINGAADPGANSPLSFTFTTPLSVNLDLNSTATGFPWDIALTSPTTSVPLGQGATLTLGGQILNVALQDPSFTLAFLGFNAPPFASGSYPLAVSMSLNVTGQMIVVNPSNAEGFSFSRAIDISFL